MLQVFDRNENVIFRQLAPVKNLESHFLFKDLKEGKYAVRYFHDENMNGRLETNFVGKPAEGYGFSNNVTAKFGPPPFEKWLFQINSDTVIILKPSY